MDWDFLTELFAPFGAIDIRRMFGGMSLSADDLTFALVLRDQIYLKADPESIPRFETEGCAPFQYEARGRPVTITSYWRMPERLYDDPDETAEWARVALAVARRAALKKALKAKRAKTVARNPAARKT
jgi:DNA transformation protein